MRYSPSSFTYGAELELADLDRTKTLPEGCGWDVRDYTMVNSDGIAVDPTGRLHDRGGEINTRPTSTIAQQVTLFRQLMRLFPEAQVNYRSNLHIHVGVPGLAKDLSALKQLQTVATMELPLVIGLVEPIPIPQRFEYPSDEAFQGARKRFRRRKVSHHTFLTHARLARQLQATSVEEFLRLEVPQDRHGNPMWHAQPRCCVNIRQLRETGTIEFRHFPGTLNPTEFRNCLEWCRRFMDIALNAGESSRALLQHEASRLARLSMPRFRPYQHELEVKYLLTCHDGSVPRDQLVANLNRLRSR